MSGLVDAGASLGKPWSDMGACMPTACVGGAATGSGIAAGIAGMRGMLSSVTGITGATEAELCVSELGASGGDSDFRSGWVPKRGAAACGWAGAAGGTSVTWDLEVDLCGVGQRQSSASASGNTGESGRSADGGSGGMRGPMDFQIGRAHV